MSSKRKQLVYSVLLIVPSVVTAAIAFYLLSNEQNRLREASRQATLEQAKLTANTISIAVSETKSGILESLAKLPDESIAEELNLWQQGSPFILSALVADESGQITSAVGELLDPPAFLTDGKVPWNEESIGAADPPSGEHPMPNVINMKQKAAWRTKLEVLERMQPRFGWWSCEDNTHGLRLGAWYRPSADSPVRAVEISVEELTKDLDQFLPSPEKSPHSFSLNSGTVQASADKEMISIPIGSELPGWTVKAVHRWENESGSNTILFGAIIVAILITTVILAGILMIRQSQKDTRIALQKSTFVSNVSHELKTPLTSIRMSAEILEEERVKDPEKIGKHLRTIGKESRRLTRLVDNVLDFSRLEHGDVEIDLRCQNIVPLVESAIDGRREALDFAQMSVEREYDPASEVKANCDSDAVETILINLIDNAIKYASSGKELHIKIEESSPVTITVSDKGPGVPKGQRESVFERFYRVESALTTQSGTGLGLSIARMLARKMGGDVIYLEKPAAGAAFRFSLKQCD